VHEEDTAKKVPVLVRAMMIPFITMKPPFVANTPVLVSTVKLLVAVGVGIEEPLSFDSSELQLVAKPAKQAGNKTVAAPNPTLAKNSFLVMIILY
jgi:hypothetical protein